MDVKCKVVWNFQSIEFEYPVNRKEDGEAMMIWYKFFLEELQSVAPEQQKVQGVAPKSAPKKKEPLASPNQVRWLVNLGYDEEEAKQLTQAEASKEINELRGYANGNNR